MDYFFCKISKPIDGTDAIAPHGCQDIILDRDGGLAGRESEIGNRPPLRQYVEIHWSRGRPKQNWSQKRGGEPRLSSWIRQIFIKFNVFHIKWKLFSWQFQIWSRNKKYNKRWLKYCRILLRKGILRSFGGSGCELERVGAWGCPSVQR